MKLTIREEKTGTVELYLEKTENGVFLCAKTGDGSRAPSVLLIFHEDGKVERPEGANIGDFKFDTDGRLIIE